MNPIFRPGWAKEYDTMMGHVREHALAKVADEPYADFPYWRAPGSHTRESCKSWESTKHTHTLYERMLKINRQAKLRKLARKRQRAANRQAHKVKKKSNEP